MDFRNKKVTVVGLGNSGLESALLLEREGAIAGVTDSGDTEDIRKNARILEKKYIDLEIAKHSEPFLEGAELVVVSPGVENSALPIRYAEENNIPIISELELGYLFCKGPIVSVTGTNGKSTVVTLIGEILKKAGIPVNVCGNIGNALCGEVEKIKKDTVVILETSSFQLERIELFRPKISVVLNVTEDHLDRYADFNEYLAAKKRIFMNQTKEDIAILNYADENLRRLAESKGIAAKTLFFSIKENVEGIYLENGAVTVSIKDKKKSIYKLPGAVRDSATAKKPSLKGNHNMENVLVSSLVAFLLGVKGAVIEKAVEEFVPLGHRFETIAVIGGIEFIDDSKATNIDATYRAIESMKKPVVLIAGGKDKQLSYEKVLPVMANRVKKIVLIGETRKKMAEIFRGSVGLEERDTLEEAVVAAYEAASSGDCVLLSPMCSSFDMFRDYKQRGEVFKAAVMGLKEKGKAGPA